MIAAFTKKYAFVIFLLLLLFVTSYSLAQNKEVVVYGAVRLIELLLFGFGAKIVLEKEGAKALPNVAFVFSVGMIFSSILAISQFLLQSSVGGALYFIGERTFSSETPGIANASLNGALALRPYASFPHPNVLSWYLFVGVVFVTIVLFGNKAEKRTQQLFAAFLIVTLIISIATILLTLSRGVILCLLVYFFLLPILVVPKSKTRTRLFIYTSLLLVAIGIFAFSPVGIRLESLFHADKAIVQRQELLDAAFSMIQTSPFLGIGMNNFIVSLPRLIPLQPVHNIFLLILAETGILGLLLFVLVVLKAIIAAVRIQKHLLRFGLVFLLIATLVLGTIDHYMITLFQAQLLFVFILSACFALGKRHE